MEAVLNLSCEYNSQKGVTYRTVILQHFFFFSSEELHIQQPTLSHMDLVSYPICFLCMDGSVIIIMLGALTFPFGCSNLKWGVLT